MSDDDRSTKPPRLHLTAGTISILITLATMGAGLIAQWTELKEARRIAEGRDLQQNAQIEKLAGQVRDLENNRAIEMRISDLSVTLVARLTAVETELSALRRDMRSNRGR